VLIDLNDQIHAHFGLVGRCTHVYGVSSKSVDPQDLAKTLETSELVMKMYWPKASRMSKEEILEEAMKAAQGEHMDDVRGHFPDLICSTNFKQYSTALIQQHLSANKSKKGQTGRCVL